MFCITGPPELSNTALTIEEYLDPQTFIPSYTYARLLLSKNCSRGEQIILLIANISEGAVCRT
jgi:hypothetical protein